MSARHKATKVITQKKKKKFKTTKVPYLVRWERRKRYLQQRSRTLRNWLRQKGQCWWPWLRKPCFGLSSTQNTGGLSWRSPVVVVVVTGSSNNCCCCCSVDIAGGKSVQSGQTITWQTGANRLCFRWASKNDNYLLLILKMKLNEKHLINTWTENINEMIHLFNFF